MYVCVWWYIREVHCVQFTVHNINTAWANINIFLPLLLMCTYEVCSFENVSFGGSKKCDCEHFQCVSSHAYTIIPLMTAFEHFLLIISPVQTETDTMMMASSTTQSTLTIITGK